MGARVLIIEDNPSNLELMSYLLVSFGHSVTKAETGESGLKAAQLGDFDVVLCDIQLPDMSGEDIASCLKVSAHTRETPLVAVTALAMLGDRDRLISKGFDGYISKPIDPESFVPQVESFAQTAVSAPKRAITAPALPPKQAVQQRGNILVLDDSGDGRYYLRIVLEPEGYRIYEAARIEEAIQSCHRVKLDLVVADMNLSQNEKGEDFLLQVKNDDSLKGVPVILITSSDSPSRQLIERLKREGAVDLLTRPISPKDLAQIVNSVLSRKYHEPK